MLYCGCRCVNVEAVQTKTFMSVTKTLFRSDHVYVVSKPVNATEHKPDTCGCYTLGISMYARVPHVTRLWASGGGEANTSVSIR